MSRPWPEFSVSFTKTRYICKLRLLKHDCSTAITSTELLLGCCRHCSGKTGLDYNLHSTRMWANAQRDGRPAEHRWRPLFNAATFS